MKFTTRGGFAGHRPSEQDSDLQMLKRERVRVPSGAAGAISTAYYHGDVIRCFVKLDNGCMAWWLLDVLEPASATE